MRACARWVGRVPDWPGRRAWAVAPRLRLSRRDLVLRESLASELCLRVQRQGFAQALFCALAPSRAEPQVSVALFLSCGRGIVFRARAGRGRAWGVSAAASPWEARGRTSLCSGALAAVRWRSARPSRSPGGSVLPRTCAVGPLAELFLGFTVW